MEKGAVLGFWRNTAGWKLFITTGSTAPTETDYRAAKELTYTEWLSTQTELTKQGRAVGIMVEQ
jgi:hypothetical protein